MFNRFYPDEDVASAYDIPYDALYKKGIRGVIFDVDNTLVPHDAPADERAKTCFLICGRLAWTPACFPITKSRGWQLLQKLSAALTISIRAESRA